MADRKLIPAVKTRTEILVANSRFISTAAPVFSVEEARLFIAQIRSEFGDATHNVPAYQVGHGTATIAHCSDDGEPSGTAGRPALAVLQGSGLGDIAVVVTRYYGGTKLGTGGLVRAYTDAVKALLEILPLAEKVPSHFVRMELPYPLYERARLLISSSGGIIDHEVFSEIITLDVKFAAEQYVHFQDGLREASHGAVNPVILAANLDQIIPLKNHPQ